MGNNKATGNDDLMTFWMGIGSQIDGLGQMGENRQYYNSNLARDFVTLTDLTNLSIDKLPPIATREVLLDMAKLMVWAILPEGTAFNGVEIKAAAKTANITIEAGDVVLFNTGWMNMTELDPKQFMAGGPGPGMDGAKYLASLGVAAVGSDT